MRADAQPVFYALNVQPDVFMSILLRDRVVVSDDFDVFPVPRRARIGDVDAIMRTVLRAEPREAYPHGHGAIGGVDTRRYDDVTSFRFQAVGTTKTTATKKKKKKKTDVDVDVIFQTLRRFPFCCGGEKRDAPLAVQRGDGAAVHERVAEDWFLELGDAARIPRPAREIETEMVHPDEDALQGDAETGGEVTPCPRAVGGEISRRRGDGGEGSRRRVREPRGARVFDVHEGQSQTSVRDP